MLQTHLPPQNKPTPIWKKNISTITGPSELRQPPLCPGLGKAPSGSTPPPAQRSAACALPPGCCGPQKRNPGGCGELTPKSRMRLETARMLTPSPQGTRAAMYASLEGNSVKTYCISSSSQEPPNSPRLRGVVTAGLGPCDHAAQGVLCLFDRH